MATEDINRELNQIKSDIDGLRRDMASFVTALKNTGMEQGRQAYEEAYASAKRTGEKVRAQADEAYGAFGREVEEHPLASVLAAFGTGFVVGMLLDRRHQRH